MFYLAIINKVLKSLSLFAGTTLPLITVFPFPSFVISGMSVTEGVTLGWENISSSHLTGNHSTASIENSTLLPEYNGTSPQGFNIRPSVGVVYLSYITLPLFAVVGIFGNTLTIIVARHKEYRTTSHGLLITVMAVTDIMYLLIEPFSKKFMIDLIGLDMRALSVYGCRVYFCFYRGSRILSGWLVMLVCLARFAMLSFPLKARVLITRRATWIAVACVFVLTTTVSSVWAMFAGIKKDKCFPLVISKENVKFGQAFNVVGMIMRTFIPAGTLVVFTPITAVKLYQQYKIRRHMTSSNNSDKDDADAGLYRVNLMLCSVVFAYLLLVAPFCIMKNVMSMTGLNIASAPYQWARNLHEIAMIFEAANCVINVVLYALLNTSFRMKILDLFSRRANVDSAS